MLKTNRKCSKAILQLRLDQLFVKDITDENYRPLQLQLHDKSINDYLSFMHEDKSNNSAAMIQTNLDTLPTTDIESHSVVQSQEPANLDIIIKMTLS